MVEGGNIKGVPRPLCSHLAAWTVIHKGEIMHAWFLVHAIFSILLMLTRPLTSVICFWCRLNGSCCCGFEIPPVWLHLSSCVPWTRQHCLTAQQKNFSLYTLLVCFPATFRLSFCLSTFFPLHSCIVYFLTFSVNAALTLLLSSPTPSHLFFSFIVPPQLFLSHCLYSFWQAYVRELVVKSITIVLHRAIFGGMTRQISVEIYWCPSSLFYFFMLSATTLVASLTKGVFQKSDVTLCPPQGCDTCCKLC